jgi:outer membrane protein
MKRFFFLSLFGFSIASVAQNSFNDLNSFLDYANQKSITLKTSDTKIAQAKKAKIAALISTIDPSGSSSLSFINNTKLGAIFFNNQTITTGTKYNSNFSVSNDLKIINLAGWENLKLAKANIEVTNSDKLLTLKSIQENIAATYYNIINLKEQLKNTEKNLAAADTLYQIANNKYKQGQVKQQDVNDTKIGVLNAKESINQLKLLIDENHTNLKILADIPENEKIEVKENLSASSSLLKKEVLSNDLNFNNSMLREKYAQSSYKQIKKSNLPTLSFIMSQSSQWLTEDFEVFAGNKIRSNYIGAKINIPMPGSNSVANTSKAKFDYEIAKQNTEQAKIKSVLEREQLSTDYEKAFSQYTTNKEIYALRKDTYKKNKNLYKAGILGLDQTINSYNAMVNADYTMTSSHVNVLLALAKIEINNTIK